MKRIALLAAALIAALSSAPSAQGTFRAGVDVVSLNVTIVDTTNHYARANLETKRKALEQIDPQLRPSKRHVGSAMRI